jgi:hypothetical protein
MPLLSAPAPVFATIPTQSPGSFVARLLLAFEWALLFAALMYIGGRDLPRAWLHLNTDFPNYYVTARLLREGYSTSRIYEWIWLQRQKDRLVAGLQDADPRQRLRACPVVHRPRQTTSCP